MIIGTVKELKNHEYRVGITPDHVKGYVKDGHTVYVEKNAGKAAGFLDKMYEEAGATILETAKEVYDIADMIIKVKEPIACEYDLMRENQILYTYLHLAPNPELTSCLMERKIKAVAYETIEDEHGNLPCLRPMSQIAGRLSIQEGAKYLERCFEGRGILLGGVPGVEKGKIVIIGGGIAGTYAAKAGIGTGAQVTMLDIDLNRLAYLDDVFGTSITTLYSTEANIEKCLKEADLVIGAVLIPGASAPKLVRREHLKMMKRGSVIVDIAIDQGGCCETSYVTTHDDPVYTVDGVVHYCVGNMPGAVPFTSTIALSNSTYHYGRIIANMGLEAAIKANNGVRTGVNTYAGKCVNENVAKSVNVEYTNIDELI